MSEAAVPSAQAPRHGSAMQVLALTLLRVAIGWHFLYEGLTKLYPPPWTAAGYLKSSTWILADFFHWIVGNPTAMRATDLLNMWGLTLIGAALMLGLFTRLSSALGMLLLALYCAAHPSLFGSAAGVPVEGSYLIVNKNLVELLALAAIAFVPASRALGVDRLIAALWARRRSARTPVASDGDLKAAIERDPLGRRAVLASLTGLPFAGAFILAVLKKKHGWSSHEEGQLVKKVDAITGATIKTFDFPSIKDLKGKLPTAKIGDVTLSRMILGGNLIGGWAHARDLIYVSKLVKAYHHREKVFETFMIAEQCGVNTILTNPVLCGIIGDYWKQQLGHIQFISDCGGRNVLDMVKQSIDGGACACYIQGGTADQMVRRGEFDTIAKALDLIRKSKMPAGIGGHQLATIKACVDKGLIPDFWMKTLHHHRYWSAQPKKQCDNIWCEHPEDTTAFMATREEPWIAFKTLAAGAIRPEQGFRYAFQNGADFICVGMYDFQMVDDSNIALAALAEHQKRERPWRA